MVVPVELDDRVFQATSLEGNDWGAPYKKLMLHNTTRLEETWHKTKVSASIDQCSVGEELLGTRPERAGVLLLEIPHFMGTIC